MAHKGDKIYAVRHLRCRAASETNRIFNAGDIDGHDDDDEFEFGPDVNVHNITSSNSECSYGGDMDNVELENVSLHDERGDEFVNFGHATVDEEGVMLLDHFDGAEGGVDHVNDDLERQGDHGEDIIRAQIGDESTSSIDNDMILTDDTHPNFWLDDGSNEYENYMNDYDYVSESSDPSESESSDDDDNFVKLTCFKYY